MTADQIYGVCVVLGIGASVVLARSLRSSVAPEATLSPQQSRVVRMAAVLGAVAGSILFEIPADRFGWTSSAAPDGRLLMGRTVIGGLALGWAAVELSKRAMGIRSSTAVQFTAPVALAFAFGRIGCALAGCCHGEIVDASGSLAKALAFLSFDGAVRWPVPWVESLFDFAAAFIFSRAAVVRALGTRLFPVFVTAWCLVRFGLEWFRDNRPVLLGLTYYQCLAVALAGIAAVVAWKTPRVTPR